MNDKQTPKQKPYTILIFDNAMVAVTDRNGKQIPALQGNIFESLQELAKADLSELCEISARNISACGFREARERYVKNNILGFRMGEDL